MVRKTHIVTKKHGMILVSFIKGKQPPFISTELDILLRIAPHQTNLLDSKKSAKRKTKIGYKEISANCVCVEKEIVRSKSFDDVMAEMIKEGKSIFWLDPTLIPTECLASIFTTWLHKTKSTTNLGLGVIIPFSESTKFKTGNFKTWAPTSSRVLEKRVEEIKLPIWYPSLACDPQYLREIANSITFFDIFPVVEFPQIIDYAAEKEIAAHHYMLDQYRTRTRNFIYLNNNSPTEALITLFESFEAIPRGGKMPRSLVITPGGNPISYLVTLLAGVLAEGIFATAVGERPYSEARDTWGFAILKKVD